MCVHSCVGLFNFLLHIGPLKPLWNGARTEIFIRLTVKNVICFSLVAHLRRMA